MIVKTFNLRVAFGNQSNFVPINESVDFEFSFENSFASNGFLNRWKLLESPSRDIF